MIVVPKFRINYKPLVPRGALDQVDPKKVMKSVQREILKAIRAEIEATAFSARAKRALKKGLTTKIEASSVKVTAKHPAFFPLLQGKKRQQMKWLTKATRPIPILLDNGELIFRSATPRSMARGRWYHPSRSPTTVIERARAATRKVIKTRLLKEMGKQLQLSLKKVR